MKPPQRRRDGGLSSESNSAVRRFSPPLSLHASLLCFQLCLFLSFSGGRYTYHVLVACPSTIIRPSALRNNRFWTIFVLQNVSLFVFLSLFFSLWHPHGQRASSCVLDLDSWYTRDIEPLDDFTNVGFEPIVWRCSILVRVSFTITWRNNASKKFNEQVFDNFMLHFAIFWFFFCKRSKRLQYIF